jgi:hypothetical protein
MFQEADLIQIKDTGYGEPKPIVEQPIKQYKNHIKKLR